MGRISDAARQTHVGPFNFRPGGYDRGQPDAQLLAGLQRRIAASLGPVPAAEAFGELGLEQVARRRLTPIERELFAFLAAPEGKDVVLQYQPVVAPGGNEGSWTAEGGAYDVRFGLDLQSPSDRFLGSRSRYQILLHELSHTMDGVTDQRLTAEGRPNPIEGYARPVSWRRPPHQKLYQEFRANLFATNGDFDKAWSLTRTSYSQGYITPDGVEQLPRTTGAVAAVGARQLTSRQLYVLAEKLTRRSPVEAVTVTPALLKELLG